MWVWGHYGLTPTSSSELFMVSHPHRQVGSLWSHTHIVKWALYGLTPTSSSELFMVSHPHCQTMWVWDHKELTWRCGCETIKICSSLVSFGVVSLTFTTEFLKFVGPRGQKIMRPANNIMYSMRLRIPSWPNLFRYLQYDLRFRLPLKK
jgi:hypothetical protein